MTQDRIEIRLSDALARQFRTCLECASAVIRTALLDHGSTRLVLFTHRDGLLASVSAGRVALHVDVGLAEPEAVQKGW